MTQDVFSISVTFTTDGPVSFSMSGFNFGITADGDENRAFVYGVDRITNQLSYVDEGHAVAEAMLPTELALLLRQRPFLVRAQRQIPGSAIIGDSTELTPDGANLASVIHRLKNLNPGRWARYMHLVNEVLPEIQDISLDFPSRDRAEIRLWSLDPGTERADLSISLEESGTGIGQILAMIFVAIASDLPRVLIIDEPQSFLHPGAVRKTIEILRTAPIAHQYVITTHSPTVINAAEPSMLLGLRKEGAETQVASIDLKVQQEVQDYLAQIGARLSDVFGMDQILWVEGPTEETCIPLILRHFELPVPLGLSIIGVVSTGDFDARRKELILEIYNRLSGRTALLPPAVAFLFDSETRTEQQQRQLEVLGRGLVRLLPRRMFENYLLNPNAIATFLTEQVSASKIERNEVLLAEVVEWLEEHKWDGAYIGEGEQSDECWRREVNGAKILGAITSHFTEQTVNYGDYKVEFGRRLTELTLEGSPSEFDEVVEVLSDTLERA